MAAAEILEVIRAQEAVKKLNDAIADSQDLIRRTDDAFRQKRIGVKEHTRLVIDEAREIDRNTRALQRYQEVLRRGERMNARHSARSAGYSGFYLSSAINRYRQSGFQGALSGIPPLAMLMGAPAGFAGAMALAGGTASQATGGGRDWLGLQKSLEYSYLESWIGQGRAGRMGKAPWAPGNFLHDFSSGFYHYLNRAADPEGPAGGTYVLGPLTRWLQQFVGDPTDPALGMDETFDERQARDDQKKEETQRKRESAIETITRMIGSRHGQTTIGSGVQRALGESRLDAETLIDAWLEEDGIGKFAQRGEAAATTERRANLRGDWSRMIERATQGNQQAITDLVKKLRKDTKALGGADELANAIMEWTLPLGEDWLRTKAQEHFAKFGRLFERSMRHAAPTLPGLTAQGREALMGQFQGQMESVGVSPETQEQIAKMFSGKAAPARAAALNVIVPMLMQAGASQREVYEALPLIFADMDKGTNVIVATQRVVNRLLRGGIMASMRGGRQTLGQQRVQSGLAMLGLDASAFEGEHSRLFPGSQQPARRPHVPVGDNLPRSVPEGGWIQRFVGPPMLGAGGGPQEAKPIVEQIAEAIAASRSGSGSGSGGPFPTAGLSAADRDKIALGLLPSIPQTRFWPGMTDFQLWGQHQTRRDEMARQGLFPGTAMGPQYRDAYRAAGTALQGGLLQGEWAKKAETIQQETLAGRERDAAIMERLIQNQALMAQRLDNLDRRSNRNERNADSINRQLMQGGRTAQNRGR